VLVFEGIDFPKTHDLEELLARIPERRRPRLTPEEQGTLTDYATGARYPGWGEISSVDARRALTVARRVRTEVRRLLPKKTIRRRTITSPASRR
jgi:HEPN domain-containing protein